MSLSRSTVSTHLAHIQALRAKHAALSSKIEREQRHPSISDLMIKQLKLEKLRLKEQIEDQGRLLTG